MEAGARRWFNVSSGGLSYRPIDRGGQVVPHYGRYPRHCLGTGPGAHGARFRRFPVGSQQEIWGEPGKNR